MEVARLAVIVVNAVVRFITKTGLISVTVNKSLRSSRILSTIIEVLETDTIFLVFYGMNLSKSAHVSLDLRFRQRLSGDPRRKVLQEEEPFWHHGGC